MGNKDFSDWNGRKRKEILHPTPAKCVHRSTVKRSEKKASFKTKVDRFRAALDSFSRDYAYRRLQWKRYRESNFNERHVPSFFYNHSFFWSTRNLKELKKMKAQYIKEGIYQKVLEAIGPWRFFEKGRSHWGYLFH